MRREKEREREEKMRSFSKSDFGWR